MDSILLCGWLWCVRLNSAVTHNKLALILITITIESPHTHGTMIQHKVGTEKKCAFNELGFQSVLAFFFIANKCSESDNELSTAKQCTKVLWPRNTVWFFIDQFGEFSYVIHYMKVFFGHQRIKNKSQKREEDLQPFLINYFFWSHELYFS